METEHGACFGFVWPINYWPPLWSRDLASNDRVGVLRRRFIGPRWDDNSQQVAGKWIVVLFCLLFTLIQRQLDEILLALNQFTLFNSIKHTLRLRDSDCCYVLVIINWNFFYLHCSILSILYREEVTVIVLFLMNLENQDVDTTSTGRNFTCTKSIRVIQFYQAHVAIAKQWLLLCSCDNKLKFLLPALFNSINFVPRRSHCYCLVSYESWKSGRWYNVNWMKFYLH